MQAYAGRLHQELINIMEILIDDRPKAEKQETYLKLKGLKFRLYTPHALFQIDRIIYSYIIDLALDFYEFNDLDVLRHIRSELLGEEPYWMTYALQYDFTAPLQDRFAELYSLSDQLWQGIKANMHQLETIENVWPAYQDIRSRLFELVFRQLVPASIGELLVAHFGNLLLHFPMTNTNAIDIVAQKGHRFSRILSPKQLLVQKATMSDQVTKLFNQITGQEVLFVDISNAAGLQGLLLNVR
ncbi:MAG: hypothetical protein K8L91_21165 [Anaerolineae bacterium]|nr:hypothetical protein [Anaerolineae bacterium]